MKILLANKFYYLKGGAERHFFDLKSLLEEKGHKTIPFSMRDEKNLESEYSKYFVKNTSLEKVRFSLDGVKTALKIIYSFEAKKKISCLIKEEKPDIAHVHNIYHQISPSILTPLKKKGIPIIMTVHDFKLMCPNYIFYTQGEVCERCKKYRYYNCILHKCIKNSGLASALIAKEMYFHQLLKIYKNNIDLYICPSLFVKNKLIEFGFNKEKITVLPHFIEQKDNIEQNNYSHIFACLHRQANSPDSHFSPRLIRHKGRTSADSYYILYFGRLSKGKGPKVLLKAMKKLKNIKLKVAGSGPEEKELKDYALENNLDNVEFLGYLSGGKLKNNIKNSLFTIMPSVFYETFGLSILESYIYKKPVIASRLGALPELILENKTGFLFESGNYDDLADKINKMLSDKEKMITMGENARKFVEGNFDKEEYYKKLEVIYNKALNKYV